MNVGLFGLTIFRNYWTRFFAKLSSQFLLTFDIFYQISFDQNFFYKLTPSTTSEGSMQYWTAVAIVDGESGGSFAQVYKGSAQLCTNGRRLCRLQHQNLGRNRKMLHNLNLINMIYIQFFFSNHPLINSVTSPELNSGRQYRFLSQVKVGIAEFCTIVADFLRNLSKRYRFFEIGRQNHQPSVAQRLHPQGELSEIRVFQHFSTDYQNGILSSYLDMLSINSVPQHCSSYE